MTDDKELFAKFEEKRKEMALGKEILDLLSDEKKEPKYLDLGYVEEFLGENNVPIDDMTFFYYGKVLRGKNCILTSNKQLLMDNSQEVFDRLTKQKIVVGQNDIPFNYEGHLGDIAPTINNEKIKFFLKDRPKLDKQKTFQTLLNKLNYYMDFGGEESIPYVQACWTIATHCYPIFYWFPNILFNAPSESGKSKNAFLLTQLSFRGYDLGASAGVTPAQIFRTLEGNRGTVWIDEFEKQEKSESQQLVCQIINAGASRDSYIIRTEQIDKKWMAKKFPIFCPKIVCNITGINPTSMSRFITFSLLKTNSHEKSKRKPYRQKDKEDLAALRDELSILILENWQQIKNIYDNLEIDLSNRDEDNWLPVCAIAKFIGGGILEKIMAYVSSYKELRLDSNDTVSDFFNILLDGLPAEAVYYTPKELSQWAAISDLLSRYKSPPHWIGRTLKSYRLETSRAGGVRKYLLSKQIINNINSRYFSTEKMTHNDTNSTNNTNNTKQHKQHKSTNSQEIHEGDVSLCAICAVIPEEVVK